jgi:hypothetical protein
MADYSLNLIGYFVQDKMEGLPSSSGIYVVYRGLLDGERNIAILKELLFIGETENLNHSMNSRDNHTKFSESLQDGEKLFYCYAKIETDSQVRKDIATVLVSHSLPTLNDLDTEALDLHDMVINIEGDSHAFLPSTLKVD